MMKRRKKVTEDMTNLAKERITRGFTQETLHIASTVPIGTIRGLEQRQRNINNTGAEIVLMLAEALGCQPVQLLEGARKISFKNFKKPVAKPIKK